MRGATDPAALEWRTKVSRPGSRVAGRYLVVRALGEGASGVVLEVRDEEAGELRALKRLAPKEPHPDARLQFRREFHTLAHLNHPAIVTAYDYGLDELGPYYTMELVPGDELRNTSSLPVRDVVRLMRDMASALSLLHTRRLVHRDLSLRNIHRTASGQPKLLDFGLICTLGARVSPAGTPPMVSPEALREEPLDQRADVYALGAVGYRLLVGRHAYPSNTLAELPAAWKKTPPSLRSIRPEIPAPLEALVERMMARDPLQRPASMSEVLDQLATLGGQPADETVATAAFLESSTTVGRERERADIRRAIFDATQGQLTTLVLEGPSGLGKTHLLHEARIEAQTRGLSAVFVRGQARSGQPYALFRALVHAIIATTGDTAYLAARSLVAARGLGTNDVEAGLFRVNDKEGDPTVTRNVIRRGLVSWVLDVAEATPLVILIDDLQRVDAASLDALASLAKAARLSSSAERAAGECPLLVLASARTDEAPLASSSLAQFLDVARRIPLAPLAPEGTEALVRAALGDFPGATRLAHWLVEAGGGNPLLCREMLGWLVESGYLRHLDGAWVVTALPRDGTVPKEVADAIAIRIGNVLDVSRATAEALAVVGGEVELADAVTIAGGIEADVLDGLDDLTARGLLVRASRSYAFPHDAVREAFLARCDPARRNELHARVAALLREKHAGDPSFDAEIGWHLLHAGRPEDAAPMLERAGRGLYKALSFPDSVRVLEAALAAYGAGVTPKTALEIRKMLLAAAATCDPGLASKYAAETIDSLRYWSGLDVADKVGGAAGIGVGVAVATGRWLASSIVRSAPGPVQALGDLIAAVGYTTVNLAGRFHVEEARQVADKLETLSSLPAGLASSSYAFCRSIVDLPLGQWGRIDAAHPGIVRVLERDKRLSDVERRLGTGTALYVHALPKALDQRAEHAALCAELEALGLRFEVAAHVVRLAYHRCRGEELAASALEQRVEALLTERASGWPLEVHVLWASGLGYALARDLTGLRRTAESLARLAADGQCSESLAALVEAEYLLAHGSYGEASNALHRGAFALAPDDRLHRVIIHTALAEAELGLDRLEDALRSGEAAVTAASVEGDVRRPWRVRAHVAIGRIYARLGDRDRATRAMADAVDEGEAIASPSVAGQAHLGAALVARLHGNDAVVAHHRARAERWFRPTENPALLGLLARGLDRSA